MFKLFSFLWKKSPPQSGDSYESIETLKGVARLPYADISEKVKEAVGECTPRRTENSFFIWDAKSILWHPNNDGTSSCPFVWYDAAGNRIISNGRDFTETKWLPDALLSMTGVMEEAYNKNTPINPYGNFWLRLVEDVVPDYAGRVEMVFIPDWFEPTRKARQNPELAASFFTSQFLEHFIGHNYGDILRENPTLERLVVFLHSQVQRDGRKQEVPTYPYDYLRYREWQMQVDQRYNFS